MVVAVVIQFVVVVVVDTAVASPITAASGN